MNNYRINYKILLYGFPPVKGEYCVDNFILKKKVLNEEIFSNFEKEDFDSSIYFAFCTYELEGDNTRYYNYLETIEKVNIEVPKSKISKQDISNYILNESIAINIIENLEKKLRLQYNTRIIFPIVRLEVYDNNDNYINCSVRYEEFPTELSFTNFNKEDFENNSRFNIKIEDFINLKNNNIKFSKAIDYYFSSFDSCDSSVRFIMLFSALEALLIKNKEKTGKKYKLASRVSNLLNCNNDIDAAKVCEDIKELYRIRSEYLHGIEEKSILIKNENILRKYVRNVLIIYWNYANDNNYDFKQIIENIDNKEEFDFNTRMMAMYLNNYDFKENFERIKEEIKQGLKKGKYKIINFENGELEVLEVNDESNNKNKIANKKGKSNE